MLVLSRKTGERVAIGDTVVVTILRLSGGRVKLGITAPDDVAVLRTEVVSDQTTENAKLCGGLSCAEGTHPRSSKTHRQSRSHASSTACGVTDLS